MVYGMACERVVGDFAIHNRPDFRMHSNFKRFKLIRLNGIESKLMLLPILCCVYYCAAMGGCFPYKQFVHNNIRFELFISKISN